MENLDVFESVFKRALREPYEYRAIDIRRVALVTDLDAGALRDYAPKAQAFLQALSGRSGFDWISFDVSQYSDWASLNKQLNTFDPQLIMTYRLLREDHESLKFSLGALLDTLTQATPWPVLVMPEPNTPESETARARADAVVVVTDHLSGDHRLINYGLFFTHEGSTLTLAHLEEKSVFNHYMAAIERIPGIDTETARTGIAAQLLKQPGDYIDTATAVLLKQLPGVTLQRKVEIGSMMDSYRTLLAETRAALLVCNTKDPSKMAMHSLGHSLAVEFKSTPMLLI